MAIVIKLKGVDWTGKGFSNINTFVAKESLIYGFDFKNRVDKYEDVTGNHTVTPYSNDGEGGVVEPNPLVAQPTADGLGVIVQDGVLVSSYDTPTISSSSEPFTVMVVGADSGINSANTGVILFALGYAINNRGVTITRVSSGNTMVQIESSTGNLNPNPNTISKTQPSVSFLTYDGVSNWTYTDMTVNGTAVGTNLSLEVTDPMIQSDPLGLGKVALGGNVRNNTKLYGNNPVIYQQAMWSKVLTTDEMYDQYLSTKTAKKL